MIHGRGTRPRWVRPLCLALVLLPFIALAGLVVQSGSRYFTATQNPVFSQIRFNPGHYATIDVGSGGGGPSGWLAQIDADADEDSIVGFHFAFDWDDMEGAEGSYSFSVTDPIVARAALYGKKVMLIPRFQYFGTSTTSPTGRFPSYLATEDGGSSCYTAWDGENPPSPAGNLILVGRLWSAACMDRWIALGEAAAAHYDENPAVEMWMIGETAIANLPGSGYGASAWLTQLQRWIPAMRAAWPHTGIRIYTNYLGGDDSALQTLFADMLTHQITGGGPDNYSRIYDSNPVFTGHSGGIDYRNQIPWVSENQAPATSSGGASVTVSQVVAHNESGALEDGGSTDPNYYVWPRGIFGGQSWSSMLTTIDANVGVINTTNPYGTGVEPEPDPGGPGPIQIVGTGTTVEGDCTSVSPAWPSTPQANDVGIVVGAVRAHVANRTADASPAVGSDFTVLRSYGANGSQPFYVWGKELAAGEGAATVVPSGCTAGDVVQAFTILIRNSYQPFASLVLATAVQATSNALSGTPIGTPALTIGSDDCLVLVLVSYQNDSSSIGNFTPFGSPDQVAAVFTSTTTGNDQSVAAYLHLQSTASNIAASSITTNGASGLARVIIIALKAKT